MVSVMLMLLICMIVSLWLGMKMWNLLKML